MSTSRSSFTHWLAITSGSLTIVSTVSVSSITFTTCSLDTEPAPGPATVVFNFTGVLNDEMRDFYRPKYNVLGEERYAAVTQQFEAKDARQAYAC